MTAINYTKDDCLNALRLASEELDDPINQETYERLRYIFIELDLFIAALPDVETICEKCGSFEQALKEAFYE
ncbi:hypothetical protein HUG15_05830 [Salicibibacter cibarius]|uniref:Uncharacterized protein n=1 Tax=Salicibibacter cibarius TaxID=2743000 RepID=A0A7T6Z1B2_9BACI|nr:hypothetical protein [Salicibibacter cibarius]QQK75114.1 hypothetical protein HUG15_05500 [Salicibibacter cibarius]QQK75174.1 hypothetical protein HUG15_05830 [Salicibibacter cibarius]